MLRNFPLHEEASALCQLIASLIKSEVNGVLKLSKLNVYQWEKYVLMDRSVPWIRPKVGGGDGCSFVHLSAKILLSGGGGCGASGMRGR